MPGGDKTGPMGAGAMSGRGMGYCAGYRTPGYMNPPEMGFVRGHGRGFGRGFGRNGGRGWRHQYYATGVPGWERSFQQPIVNPDHVPQNYSEDEFRNVLKRNSNGKQTVIFSF